MLLLDDLGRRSAVASRDLAPRSAAARDPPSVVTLTDAVQVLVLMDEAEDRASEVAAVRWIARLTTGCRVLPLGSVHAALEALGPPDAMAALLTLSKRHSA